MSFRVRRTVHATAIIESPWVVKPPRPPAWKIVGLVFVIAIVAAIWVHSVTGMLMRAHLIDIARAARGG